MCTLKRAEATEIVLAEMAAGKRVFWKVYRRVRRGRKMVLQSPFRHNIISGPGVIDSGRKTTRAFEVVCRAIHVLRNKQTADNFRLRTEVVVPVLCKPEDFIAADGRDAAFRKVRLTRSEWRKATKTIPNAYSAM